MKITQTTALAATAAFFGGTKHSASAAAIAGRNLFDNNDGATRNWWEFGMADPILDEIALFYLGHTWFQGADIGEVLETMYRTNHSDPWSWHTEFTKTAERLEDVGKTFDEEGHSRSAGQSYLRAATYRRASLHRHPDPFHPDVPVITQQAADNFDKFLALTEYPCEAVQIPYEDTTLPAYLCLSDKAGSSPAPTIIYNQGKDGWMEDGKNVVDEAMARGWHTLLFDGPGMGRTIRLQELPFRHDWEVVMTAVIDFAVSQPQVDSDNLAHISLSLGGFLAPRAACYEHRLKALVANPGVVSWYRVYESELTLLASAFGFGPEIFDLLENDPAAFDAEVLQMMETNAFLHWGFVDSMWHHGVDSPSALMNEIKLFSIEDKIGDITTSTLVVDADAETRAQALELYEGLTGAASKEYLKFSAAEAAQFHDQPGAMGIQSARIFNWLDGVLETKEAAKDEENGDVSSASKNRASVGMSSILAAAILSFTTALS